METKEQPQYERERTRETKETKEVETNPEAQAAAAMERAEIIVKEVKNNKKQMQNIVLHMGQVQQAIKALRQQLALADSDDVPSVAQDAATVERLKKQIHAYKEELLAMRDDLLRAQLQELTERHPELTAAQREELARQTVARMIEIVDEV